MVWGDARVGNMCFADDLSVVALFDWETAGTGPPDIDLGWWLMFERFLCEALGFTRLPGVPDDDEFVRRYQEFGGTSHRGHRLLPVGCRIRAVTDQQSARPAARPATAWTPRPPTDYPQTSVALVQEYLEALR